MVLRRFQSQGLRNLAPLELSFPPGVSLIHGPNGSGKTSLLEAIYTLGTGRSFRSALPAPAGGAPADAWDAGADAVAPIAPAKTAQACPKTS